LGENGWPENISSIEERKKKDRWRGGEKGVSRGVSPSPVGGGSLGRELVPHSRKGGGKGEEGFS